MTDTILARLLEDHRRIEAFLDGLVRLARSVDCGRADADATELAVEFVDVFVERFHHVREEHVLFQYLMESSKASEPVGDYLVHCHDDCRDQLEGMRRNAGIDTVDRRTGWSWNARAYVQLMREHVRMENEGLYPTIRSRLDADDEKRLVQRLNAMFPDEAATNRWADDAISRVDPAPRSRSLDGHAAN